MFAVNSKIAQNKAKYLKFHRQNIEYTRNGTLRRLSRRFQTLIWRTGETVQNLESPGLSGRVDSPVIFAPLGSGGEGKVHTQLTAQQES